jgi:hypothetical protein
METLHSQNVEQYLRERLARCSRYELTDSDRASLGRQGVVPFLESKMLSAQFRKFGIPPEVRVRVRRAVEACVTAGAPVDITFAFGAYKLHHFPSYPEVDWAELRVVSPKHVGRRRARGSHRGNISRLRGVRYR